MLGHVCLDDSHLAKHGTTTTCRRKNPERYSASCISLVLIVTFLAVKSPPVAAEDIAAEPHAVPAESSDQDLAALLLKIEQQIADRHMVSPASDNAMETWQRVIESAVVSSPETVRTLDDFVTHFRNRAANEQAAGQPSVSMDFAALADLATSLLGRNDLTLAAVPDNSPAKAALPESPQPLTALLPPSAVAGSSVAGGADANPTLPPTPTDKAPLDVVLAPAVSPVPRAPTAQELAVAAQFASRGDQMMVVKDISAARRFYEFAANAGNAHAAAALARTFDPRFFRQAGVIGLRPDPELAATWYRKAAALGDPDSGTRLQGLGIAASR